MADWVPKHSTVASGNNPASGSWDLGTEGTDWDPGDLAVFWLFSYAGLFAITEDAEVTEKVDNSGGANGRLFVGYRWLQTGDAGIDWTRATGSSNSTTVWGVDILEGGTGSGDPWNAVAAEVATGSSTDPDPPSVTPTEAGSTVWGVGGRRLSAGGSYTPPTDYALGGSVDSVDGQDASGATIMRHGLPASAEDPGAIVMGGASGNWSAWAGALTPSSGGAAKALRATAAAKGSAAGRLTAQRALRATTRGTAAAAGRLTATRALRGMAGAMARVSGQLTTSTLRALSGVIPARSGGAGALSVAQPPEPAPAPAPQAIETWVTTPAGVYIAHLERSVESPFRAFAFSRVRNQPGAGSLEYHPDNAILREFPTLFAMGNLVWMRYRDVTRTWIIEDEAIALDESEHASDWRQVSGRGVLQLVGDRIVFPTGFAGGTNGDRSTWGEDNQWRRFVDRAAGEMLWDLIDESNPRSTTTITRGAIETTGDDGWTQDLTFENLLEDVVKSVTEAHGDVEMIGLEFNYYNRQGIDVSRVVIFEESADILRLAVDRSDRDRVSYIVGEGVGEGVFAKLATAERADARRIEGFAAFKEATNLPLLEVLTDSALTEHERRETVSFDVSESRFLAFTDYDLGDTVRVIAPSRGVDEVQRIDAMYVAEVDDVVRISIDVAGLRTPPDLDLEDQIRRTRSELGVRNRQPQGQLVPFSFNGADVFDDTDTMDVFLFVPDRMYLTLEAKAELHFREFFAPATAATASGDLTTTSGGGSTSGASSASTTNDELAHVHKWAQAGGSGGGTPTAYTAGGVSFTLDSDASAAIFTEGGAAHQHGMAHTHSTPAHQHSTPGHGHGLDYGVTKEAMPATHSVELRLYEREGASWALRTTITGLTDDIEVVDLSQWLDGPGSWRLSLKSAAGQPQGGRLGCDVSGYVLGAIKSA